MVLQAVNKSAVEINVNFREVRIIFPYDEYELAILQQKSREFYFSFFYNE